MTPSDRRMEIWEVLCQRRHDTYDNLAHEFQVSKGTIRNDIKVLMCSHPIETVSGRYGGGVKISDTYFPCRSTLTPEQSALLRKLRNQLDGHDCVVLNSILCQFGP